MPDMHQASSHTSHYLQSVLANQNHNNLGSVETHQFTNTNCLSV